MHMIVFLNTTHALYYSHVRRLSCCFGTACLTMGVLFYYWTSHVCARRSSFVGVAPLDQECSHFRDAPDLT